MNAKTGVWESGGVPDMRRAVPTSSHHQVLITHPNNMYISMANQPTFGSELGINVNYYVVVV
jgi:hypothetical protein